MPARKSGSDQSFADKVRASAEKALSSQEAALPEETVETPPATDATAGEPDDGQPVAETGGGTDVSPQPTTGGEFEPGVNWQKRYSDLQSDMDRRVNQATSPLYERIDALTTAILQQQNIRGETPPAEPVDPSEIVADPAKFEKHIRQLVETAIRQGQPDPAVSARREIVTDFMLYRQAYPEANNPVIDEMVGSAVKAFNLPRTFDGLSAAYKYVSQSLGILQQAGKQAATAKAKSQPVSNGKPAAAPAPKPAAVMRADEGGSSSGTPTPKATSTRDRVAQIYNKHFKVG